MLVGSPARVEELACIGGDSRPVLSAGGFAD
jgi:hypothetical protein